MIWHFIGNVNIEKSLRDGRTKAQWAVSRFFYSCDAEVDETNDPRWYGQPSWQNTGKTDEANPIGNVYQLCVQFLLHSFLLVFAMDGKWEDPVEGFYIEMITYGEKDVKGWAILWKNSVQKIKRRR